jgi:HEAT repeat protein
VREAAVTRLDAMTTGAELPFLLLRVNDWVGPVAECAEQAVRHRVRPEFADAFVRNLPILRRLEISRRRDHRGLLGSVERLLGEPACRAVVERGLDALDVHTRRLLFRIARERPDFDNVALVRQALRDADTVVRIDAVNHARTTLSPDTLRDVLDRILRDRYPRVRREGVAAAAGLSGEEGRKVLITALLDRNQVVREIARFYLLRRGELRDFASFYREQIVSGVTTGSAGTLAIAITGLGETGSDGDAGLLASFLDHPRPAVRRASIRAIATVAIEREVHRLVPMLADESPGVSHMARQVLRPRAPLVGLPALRAILRDAPHAHSRFDAVSVGGMLGKWDRLLLMLQAAGDTDASIRETGRAGLGRWLAAYNRTSAQPTGDQLREIERAMEERVVGLAPPTMRELRAIHEFWAGTR